MQETVFRKNIEVKKEMELLYRGIRYKLGYGIDNAGKSYISFGEEFLPAKHFYSYGQLVNEAMLGISPLRDSIEVLQLLNP
ncbi:MULTISPECIES: hypothetical protein [unclassified Treponema]|uniref:hypothetical protein n=1 Tax=unclassified Treponema TaxID=2638727 RepID=UPI0025F5F31A|nr:MULTISPECIES: hypothetical protein [unclassified Treponema]